MIQIIVSKFNSRKEEEILYRNNVDDNVSLSFPFNNIISSLRILYPKSDVITFKIV